MANISPRRQIQDWLNRLAIIVPKAMEVTDLAAKIDELTDLLGNKIPPELFNPDSLEFCARKFRFFPSYAELWDRLQAFSKEHPPVRPALPAPVIEDATLSVEDKRSVRTFLNFRGKDFDHLAEQAPTVPGRMAISLGVFRRHSPGAFAYICRTDAEAHEIARRRGWLEEDDPKKGWGNALAITKSVLKITAPLPDGRKSPATEPLLGILRASVAKYAPEHLGLIPPAGGVQAPVAPPHSSSQAPSDAPPAPQPPNDAQSRLRAEFRARHGRELGTLTPEQLQAAYAAAGTSGPPRPAPKASVPSWDHKEDDR